MTHLLFTRHKRSRGRLKTLTTGLVFVYSVTTSALAFAAPLESEKASKGNSPGAPVEVRVSVSEPTMLSGKNQTNHVRIALKGSQPLAADQAPTVNVSIVIDTSGSMQGKKIKQAKAAAIAAVDQLRDQDIVSVVLYDSAVTVLVPSTKAIDRDQIKSKIQSIQAGGSTALFAGVSKGAAEVRKFISDEYVNRVILLSDGQANVGPKSPRELERLGVSLVKEGISVTTLGLGLGYNEDLMSGLAAAGSGNHLFVEQAQDLVAVFKTEFNNLLNVVASNFKIKITTAENVRPVRVLGIKADVVGRDVFLPLAQLYGDHERYFILEVEVDSEIDADDSELVSVDVSYQNLIDQTKEHFASSTGVRLTRDPDEVEKRRDYETYAYCTVQIANVDNQRATALRDAGQVKSAENLLNESKWKLEIAVFKCANNGAQDVVPELNENLKRNSVSNTLIQDENWSRNRKKLKEQQYEVNTQQRLDYEGKSKR